MHLDRDLTAGLRRARRTAALARAVMALGGIAIALLTSDGGSSTVAAVVGFAVIVTSSLVQLMLPRARWLMIEESIAPASAVLIVGFGPERVTTSALLWLCCVACGVLARGGRVHWLGRTVLLLALALPFAKWGVATIGYVVFCLATIVLLLTCGRVTQELRALLEHARHEADHDGLTGLLSRRTFRAELEQIAADAARAPHPARGGAALLLVDLDAFGAVNKSAGHAAGDALLVEVAARIRAGLGEEAVVGRLGGDEFAAIIRTPDPVAVGEALLDDLARSPGVRASAGLALLPRDGEDAEGPLRAVDVALRVAKRSGRSGVAVYAGQSMSPGPGGAQDALTRLIGGEGLDIAVQPIVSVPDGAIHAYESLARFSLGATPSPLHWFALADELGMRDELELACLRAGLAILPTRPVGTSLTINLSGPLLLDSRVTALLDDLATLDGLILELTENSPIEDSATMHAEISRLIARGVRLAVDDMGAGYAGLRQITTLRPSYLKLDRSLVSGIDSDPDRGALVAAMVGYARQTGGHLVAEGVETVAELEMLVALGVPLVQGYHLARPGPPWPRVRVADPPAGVYPAADSLTTTA